MQSFKPPAGLVQNVAAVIRSSLLDNRIDTVFMATEADYPSTNYDAQKIVEERYENVAKAAIGAVVLQLSEVGWVVERQTLDGSGQ